MGMNVPGFLQEYSPAILSGCAVAGVIGTGILAAKASPVAQDILSREKYERKEDRLPISDTVKLTWKCYAPAVIMGTATIACIVASTSQSSARNAALASAYGLASASLKEYKDAVIETVGEKKAQEVHDKVAERKLERAEYREQDVIPTDKGNTLCFDRISGRYFYSDIEYINRTMLDLNRTLIADDWVDLNWLYDRLGLESINLGDQLGWSSEQQPELSPSSRLAPNTDIPCYVVDFTVDPVLRASCVYSY